MTPPRQDDFEKRRIILGILLMMSSIFLYAANDAMGKWLVVGFGAGQVVFIRSFGAFLILAPMFDRQSWRGFFKPQKPLIQIVRLTCATLDTILFYVAIKYLPLADFFTFYMAGPIYVAVISHFFLHERVGWRRGLAIIGGFLGVLVALRPGAEMFSLPAILAILCSLCYALVIVCSRALRQTPDAVLVGWQTLAALAVGCVMMWFEQWHSPTLMQWGALILLGVISCAGHVLTARSLKLAPASILAPLQYAMLLWGIVFGIIFFGDYPDMWVLAGAVIIMFAGLFIFHRKKVVNQNLPKTDVGDIRR